MTKKSEFTIDLDDLPPPAADVPPAPGPLAAQLRQAGSRPLMRDPRTLEDAGRGWVDTKTVTPKRPRALKRTISLTSDDLDAIQVMEEQARGLSLKRGESLLIRAGLRLLINLSKQDPQAFRAAIEPIEDLRKLPAKG